jgi:hypothetical protein
MADLKLDIIVVPTYSTLTLGVMDGSVYPTNPPNVESASMRITIPGFGEAPLLPFDVGSFNIYNSGNLGITDPCIDQPLPDGIYRLRYSIAPAYLNYVEKTIMRTEKLQEKFDRAFLQLDLMECDRAIKTQSTVTLNTINFFIQGSIAAGNNCAEYEANRLYTQADNMLNSFLKSNCGCSGNNYQINFN